MKRVLLISAGLFHPPLLARLRLQRLLSEQANLLVHFIRSLEDVREEFLDYSAWVLYYHQKKLSPQALARLQKFVSEGGGLLALHSATASFKDCPAYFEVLGGRFLTHGKVTPFEITPVPQSPIFSAFERFQVRDELYVHELNPAIQVHFVTELDQQLVPVVWSFHYGKGRVLYAMPGHCSSSLSHPAYRRLLLQGLAWVSAGREG
ncbi:MAG: ThuA domain-containing protein [Anaerolineales bacterium]|nr:ThuA domain-containing protein [Anaerolineales bacterium]MDW8161824.1 ThuA domain-containing protein [Anaerolineales bacterium]